MPEQRDVKVFISWSGDLAKEIAVALREWLPLLFDRVAPWASDTDIAAGQRGLSQIELELAGTQFGIVVVTADNQDAPWLNFEAGALSKTIVGDLDQRVVPLLVDLAGASQLTGPLRQFQAKTADEEGVQSLLLSLADVAGIDQRVVQERFAAYWNRLEAKIAQAQQTYAGGGRPSQPRRPEADLLEEILVHVRQLRSESENNPLLRTLGSNAASAFLNSSQSARASRNNLLSLVNAIAAEHGLTVLMLGETADGWAAEVDSSHADKKTLREFARSLDYRVTVPVKVIAYKAYPLDESTPEDD